MGGGRGAKAAGAGCGSNAAPESRPSMCSGREVASCSSSHGPKLVSHAGLAIRYFTCQDVGVLTWPWSCRPRAPRTRSTPCPEPPVPSPPPPPHRAVGPSTWAPTAPGGCRRGPHGHPPPQEPPHAHARVTPRPRTAIQVRMWHPSRMPAGCSSRRHAPGSLCEPLVLCPHRLLRLQHRLSAARLFVWLGVGVLPPCRVPRSGTWRPPGPATPPRSCLRARSNGLAAQGVHARGACRGKAVSGRWGLSKIAVLNCALSVNAAQGIRKQQASGGSR